MPFAAMARGFGCSVFLASLNLAFAQPYVITTFAGGAPPPTPSAAVNSSLPIPSGVAADNAGNQYFTSDNCVFKIDPTGNLTRIAGTARAGYAGDGGPAASAQLNGPYGVAIDSSGNLYVADGANNRIRKITSGGVISTIAGSGTAGYSGDGALATSAQLNNPLGVAVDSAGNVYIADSYNERIRKVSTSGVISTVAGNGNCCYNGDNISAISAELYQPESLAVDASGNVYIADLGNNRIRKVSSSGTITTVAGNGTNGFAGDNGPAASAQLEVPWAVALDTSGNLYISDSDRIRKVSNGVITTIAGADSSGFSGDGGPAAKALLDGPFGLTLDTAGNIYIADTGNNRIRKVTAAGVISTIAGNGTHSYSGDNGPATSAQMYNPQAVALDAAGDLYVTDYARVREVSSGTITTAAGNGTQGYLGDSGPAIQAELNQPAGLAVDSSGNLYIADSANNRIRSVAHNGTIQTFAGAGTAGYSGDGSAASAAQLNNPQGVAVDSTGNVYIADTGNGVIRKVTPSGTIATIAGNGVQGYSGDGGTATSAQLNFPRSVAIDAAGNLYIADFGNGRVRKVTPSGGINTVAGNGQDNSAGAGGPATSAGISPQGVAVDASGNLYIADFNNFVWKVLPTGIIAIIAGTGASGYTGDGGSALSAQLSDIEGLAVDPAGNVYLADTSNYAVRVLRPVTMLLSITTSSPLPPASAGAPYSQQLAATGGSPPYSWSIVSGALPAGLTLATTGFISGVPTAAGTSSFTIQVTDSNSLIATQSFTLAITVPTITTTAQLPQATVGLSYSQTLAATGGDPPYTWTISSGALPAGLSLSTGGAITGTPTLAGTYNFTLKLADSASNSATLAFTLIVLNAPPLTRTGVFAHIAAGGGWTTTIYLANTSSAQIAVELVLHADDGTALNLPVTVTQQGATQSMTASSLSTVINPNASLVLTTTQQSTNTVTGWVDVLSSAPLSGFADFADMANGAPSQGTAPLQAQFQSAVSLPYDNRGGNITAIALANLATSAAPVTVTIWDPSGNQIGVLSITPPLAANGHTSFLLPTLFPQTSGIQGIVEFQSSAGNLAGIGLLATEQGTFTSIPVTVP